MKLSIVGGGVVGALAAVLLDEKNMDFDWYVGETHKTASLAAGAMVCTYSEWDRYLDEETELSLVSIRESGSRLLSNFMERHNLKEFVSGKTKIILDESKESDLLKTNIKNNNVVHSAFQEDGKEVVYIEDEFSIDAKLLFNYIKNKLSKHVSKRMPDFIYENSSNAVIVVNGEEVNYDHCIVSCGSHSYSIVDNKCFSNKNPKPFSILGLAILASGSDENDNVRYLNEDSSCGIHLLKSHKRSYFGATADLKVFGREKYAPTDTLSVLFNRYSDYFSKEMSFNAPVEIVSGYRSIIEDRIPVM